MPAPSEVRVGFRQYVDKRIQRLGGLRELLEVGLPIVADLNRCNSVLIESGRPDLVVTERAAMMPVGSPDEVISKCNNFTPNFVFITGTKAVKGEEISDDYETISVTRKQLIQLRTGMVTPEEIQDESVEDSFGSIAMSHAAKPAFQRMLVIFPNFTIGLILEMSDHRILHRRDARFEPELFVAYQLMGQLVDARDEHVMQDGKVDDWYLCR